MYIAAKKCSLSLSYSLSAIANKKKKKLKTCKRVWNRKMNFNCDYREEMFWRVRQADGSIAFRICINNLLLHKKKSYRGNTHTHTHTHHKLKKRPSRRHRTPDLPSPQLIGSNPKAAAAAPLMQFHNRKYRLNLMNCSCVTQMFFNIKQRNVVRSMIKKSTLCGLSRYTTKTVIGICPLKPLKNK